VPQFLRLSLILSIASASAFAGAIERSVLQEINLARTQPQAYASVIANHAPALGLSPRAVAETTRYLQKQKPVGALVESAGLTQAAMSHAFDTGPRGMKGHRGSDGSRVTHRADRFGRWDQLIGENLIYGKGSARDWVVSLIVDEGVGDRYHRVNIFKREFRLIGIATGPHATAGRMMVTDFAAKYLEGGAPVATR
jgi:uncharacterized protein YkwD